MATGTLERTAAEAVAAALSEQDQATLTEYARGVMAGGSWTPKTTAADVLEHTVSCGQFSRAGLYVSLAGDKLPSHGWLPYVVHAHIMLHWPLQDESVLALLHRAEELSRSREREEYHDALMAVSRALTSAEAVGVCVEAVRRWPRMQGAGVADVLAITTDHDLFLNETESFPDWDQLPDFRGNTAAMHALILLGRPLTLDEVLALVRRARGEES